MTQWSSDDDRVSGAVVEADFNGAVLRGMQKIDLSDEVERAAMYGNSSVSIGIPAGTHKGEFTIESIPEEVDEFLGTLGDQFYRVPGTFGISLVRATGLITFNVTRCYLNKNQVSLEAGGQKGSTQTLTGIILDPIDWNGLRGIAPKAPTAFSFPTFSF